MLKKDRANEQGFTFIEILVCLAIVALIVGPISFSLLASIKTRVSAESLTEVTLTTECLMEDIKAKITADIYNKQEVEGKRKVATNFNLETEGYKGYLIPYNNRLAGDRDQSHVLSGFLPTAIDLQTAYNTNRYAYEVALWKLEDVTLVSNQLQLTADQLKKAVKLHTDNAYKLEASDYSGTAYPITFATTAEMLKIFNDSELIYVPNRGTTEQEILDVNKVSIKDDGTLDTWNNSTNQVKVEVKIIDVDGSNRGYVITCSPNGTIDSTIYPITKSRSIIEVNLTDLIGDIGTLKANVAAGAVATEADYTLKFINKTGYNQTIRVKNNFPSTLTAQEIAYAKAKYNIVVEDIGTSVKSTIVNIDNKTNYDNYLIAIIAREKSPAMGNPGKIVKRMIDVYSYDAFDH